MYVLPTAALSAGPCKRLQAEVAKHRHFNSFACLGNYSSITKSAKKVRALLHTIPEILMAPELNWCAPLALERPAGEAAPNIGCCDLTAVVLLVAFQRRYCQAFLWRNLHQRPACHMLKSANLLRCNLLELCILSDVDPQAATLLVIRLSRAATSTAVTNRA